MMLQRPRCSCLRRALLRCYLLTEAMMWLAASAAQALAVVTLQLKLGDTFRSYSPRQSSYGLGASGIVFQTQPAQLAARTRESCVRVWCSGLESLTDSGHRADLDGNTSPGFLCNRGTSDKAQQVQGPALA